MLKKVERCIYYSKKENTLWIIRAEKGKAIITKSDAEKQTDINFLRSLDIFFERYETETQENIKHESASYVQVDYEGETVFFADENGLFEDIERYFKSCFNETASPASVVFNSFDGGGPEYTFENEVKGIFTWYGERRYNKPDHEQLCGAGYDVIFKLYPLRMGKASAKVTAFSPICAEPPVRVYVEVDGGLKLSYRIEQIDEDDF